MLNAAILGNLGSDPELKHSANGTALLRFNVAANQRVKVDGEWADRTEWVRCTLFGARAESLAQRLTKGTKVYVSGRLEARPWTAQDGSIRSGLEITASDVEFMSPREGAGDGPQRTTVAAGHHQQGSDDGDLESMPF